MVHVYNPKGIARALKAGVRSIEHGHLIDEPTMQLLADSGAWLSMQAFCRGGQHYPSPVQQAKHLQICSGTTMPITWQKKIPGQTGLGHRSVVQSGQYENQNHGIVKLKKWFSNFEI